MILYVGLILLLHLPFVQQGMGEGVARLLSRQIGSKITIDRVDVGFLNRLIIDDLDVYDPQGQQVLIHSARLAVTLDLPNLLQGDVNITTAQVFGLHVVINRKTSDSPLNIQYIIDAFSSKDDDESSCVNLKISSLILRHVHITYDVLSEPLKSNQLDVNHLDVNHLGLTASIKALTEDSLNVSIRRLNFIEENSRLSLKNLETSLAANQTSAIMDSLHLQTQTSDVRLGMLKVQYEYYDQRHQYEFSTTLLPSYITPSEFAPLYVELANQTSPVSLEACVEGNEQQVKLGNIRLHTDDHAVQLHSDVRLAKQQQNDWGIDAEIHQLQVSPNGLNSILNLARLDEDTKATIMRVGQISATGHVNKENDVVLMDLKAQTDAGDLSVNGNYTLNEQKLLSAHIESSNLKLGQIVQNELLGNAAFNLDVDAELTDTQHLTGNVYGDVQAFDYNGYTYNNIFIDGTLAPNRYSGLLSVDDEHLQMIFDGTLSYPSQQELEANMQLSVNKLEPYALNLTRQYEDETFRFTAVGNVKGKDLASAVGTLVLDSIAVTTLEQTYTTQAITIRSEQLDVEKKHIVIHSDFIDASFVGNINYTDIVPSFQNQLAQHLPSLIHKAKTERKMDTAFDFNMEVTDDALTRHFIDADIQLLTPARITGRLDAQSNTSHIQLDMPRVEYEGTLYEDIQVTYNGSPANFRVNGGLLRRLENGTTRAQLNALAHDDLLTTHLSWNQQHQKLSEGSLSARTLFTQRDGQLDTHIHIQPSQLSFDEKTWLVKPADIYIQDKTIECRNVEVSHRDRYVKVNGIISETPSDSLIVQLNNVDVDYVLSIVDFTAVDFRGRAFGNAYVSNIYKKPKFNAALRVEDLAIGNGVLGLGNLRAHWDDDVDGIRVNGHIVDTDEQGRDRITDCSGYIAPSKNYINLNINADNTNAYFLNDFLGGVFRNIHGSANGVMNVIGPLNDIGLIGDMSTQVDMTLRATGVTYHVEPQDTLRFRPNRFRFDNVRIYDDEHNEGIVNGYVTHRNVKNFAYEFRVDMKNLLAYSEEEFNSDKFMGKVYSNGWLTVKGADRTPLNINADISPTRGSFFAYDAATPDAIASSSFITFRDVEEVNDTIKLADIKNNHYEYHGDIFMNVAIHLNPECAIKLRMDNIDDGYITTYGTGKLQAFYHNKGSFTLNGTYNIQSGRYRLYLQDIIYRDLELQNGSSVVFNGNPFDANIHLICHHTINSVPLTDLTAGMTTTSSNKVKVICILDITGKLGNMNFKFDLNLPNVNDETRQLVRSYITTEEDMNMQMIYLLGLGRFYTNEYARSTGQTGGSQTMNTLLSSTISGQINQMLSNVIGTDSKWNFGTGLSTGEFGWNDLDVEGMLSGRLLDDRLLINGNFGYRDNTLTQNSSFIGDFDVKWRIRPNGNTYLKAYNKTNDRYFTKATLNTQGVGISYQRDFEHWRDLFRRKMREEAAFNTQL
ncbi:MAG: translocation/assembly module TamB [Bacteroidaceae bacterium]|nr:translocation/assembly module TamB [Bacteroidaceae bacterium]